MELLDAAEMQRLADVLGIPVERAAHPEATARGAAARAGVLHETDLVHLITIAIRYEPRIPQRQADEEYTQWSEWLTQARRLRTT